MHARTEFVDEGQYDSKGLGDKRHLLRMWLSPRNSRQLSAEDGFFREKHAGVVRGGFPNWGGEKLFQTPAVDV